MPIPGLVHLLTVITFNHINNKYTDQLRCVNMSRSDVGPNKLVCGGLFLQGLTLHWIVLLCISNLMRIPVAVKDDDGVGRLQIEAEASCPGAEQEDKVL